MVVALRLPAGARSATLASGAMIAQQVAGKAARDAIFLSSFRVEDLPAMMAASAVVSLAAALGLSRLMLRYSPAKVVPLVFAASGVGLMGEWALTFVAPRIAAVALYLHTALFGGVVISAFWLLVNETFAPHAGRRAVTWITGGGTMGGVIGGLVAWRVADQIALPSILPLIACISMISAWGCWRLDRVPPSTDETERAAASASAAGVTDEPLPALVGLVRSTPYLRNLALVVLLGAVTSGLLDYVFSAVAVDHYTKGPQLLAFFAKFWLGVGLLSFLLQSLLGRIALERLGLALTVAVLPLLVVLGSALGVAVPGLGSMVVVRGAEASQRNSLFRAAYELLYTPLSAQRKRTAKAIIDVGCDRAGTVLAGGIAMLIVELYEASLAGTILLVVAMACALATAARSTALHRGYVALLEENLRGAADKMGEGERLSDPGVLRVTDEIALVSAGDLRAAAERSDAELRAVLELRSGTKERARRVLCAEAVLTAPLVAFTVQLLADEELQLDAIEALVKASPTSTGQLVDALCDPRIDFRTRRRIPRVLSRCPTLPAAEGLVRGLEDPRFEVRYACGRALLKVKAANPHIVVTLPRVVAIVTREIGRDKTAWDLDLAGPGEGENDGDEGGGGAAGLGNRLRRDLLDRSVEHVFNVLALYLDPASLGTAFKALHEEDAAIRGTALEYLETVLPDGIRDLVWPVLGEARPMRAARPVSDILADLTRVRDAPAARPE